MPVSLSHVVPRLLAAIEHRWKPKLNVPQGSPLSFFSVAGSPVDQGPSPLESRMTDADPAEVIKPNFAVTLSI